jgi:transposase
MVRASSAAMFASVSSHCLFEDRFGRPGKGNDKGMVSYARRNFLVPIPRARDWGEMNAMPLERCRDRQSAVLRGAGATIGERMEATRPPSWICRRRRS